MASLRPSIFSPSLDDVLLFIDQLPDGEFGIFADEVNSSSSFDQSEERCEDLARRLNTDPETVKVVVNAIAYLYGLAFSRLQSEADLHQAVTNMLEVLPGKNSFDGERITDRLITVLKRLPARDQFRKAQRLREGFLPNAAAFASMVDLRPNFKEDQESISEFIPVIQFRISTDSDRPNERQMVFQMDQAALSKLKAELDKVERKLARVGDKEGVHLLAPKNDVAR